MPGHTRTITVPTAGGDGASASRDVVDLGPLDAAALRELAKSDAFLFHSIPEVRACRLSLKDVDAACAPRPLPAKRVRRRTRVTTECHASVLLDDLLLDDEFWRGLDTPEGDLLDLLLRDAAALAGGQDKSRQTDGQ